MTVGMTTTHLMAITDMIVPVNVTAECGGEWANGTLPRDFGWTCALTFASDYEVSDEEVRNDVGMVGFWLEPHDVEGEVARAEIAGVQAVREELSYTMYIVRDGRNSDGR